MRNIRRHPHLAKPAQGHETDPLDLLRSLPPGAAREAERMLQVDHQAAKRAAKESPIDTLTAVADARLARGYMTGGGRRRNPEPAT